jgi:quercetin dioxygenase-like cupin family protein
MPYFDELTGKDLAPGLTGRYIHGSKMTLGQVTIKAGSRLEEHQHPHEQITVILKGTLEMKIGGISMQLHTGMVYVIPSDTLHSANAITDCIVLDAFYPIRKDYQ